MNLSRGFSAKKPGSLGEVLQVILPLMAVALSENLMIFFDRIILAHYSLLSFNSVTIASQAIEILQYAIWAIASMTEVFIARLYAHKKLTLLARPIWQMIYLSIFSIPLVFIIGLLSVPIVLHGALYTNAAPYYLIMMATIPLIGIIAAISGFFIGQGKLKIVVYTTLFSSLVNLALDFILIFGINHFVPAFGTTGAAISAVISLFLQMLWLGLAFFTRHNRKKFKTTNAKFCSKEFKKLLKLGLPIALTHSGEMLAWLVILKLISATNITNLTIISIGSTLYLVFAFVIEGVYRGLTTISSYYYQLKESYLVKKSFSSCLFLLITFMLLLLLPFFIFPNIIINLFNLANMKNDFIQVMAINMRYIWLYFFLLAIFWLYAALMTAKNKTKTIMFINIISIWCFAVLPLALLIYLQMLHATFIWKFINIYMLTACVLLVFAFYHHKRKARKFTI